MANTTIYYPLIKKGFQELTDTSSIESDIKQLQSDVSTLQSNKVTKCFNAADLANLSLNEIFQWQGENTTIEGVNVVNGYFYKYVPTETITITPPKIYYTINNDIVTNLVTIKSGVYYQNGGTSAHGTVYFNYNVKRFFAIYDKDQTPLPNVGTYIFDAQNMLFSQIVSVQGNWDTVTDNLGNVFDFYTFDTGTPGGTQFNFISSNGLFNYDIANQSDAWFFVTINNKECVIVAPRLSVNYTDTPIIITKGGLQQTDSQPRLQNITNGEGGSVDIATDTNISGNLTVEGSQTIVHVEDIQSENDYITLRADNPLALGANELSGITVNNYDGNNTDCILAVDVNGWARVGDSSGTLEKLATIEENPTDGAFLKYNATDKELQSTTDGSELSVTFTAQNVSGNILTGDTLAVMAKKISQLLGAQIIYNTTTTFTNSNSETVSLLTFVASSASVVTVRVSAIATITPNTLYSAQIIPDDYRPITEVRNSCAAMVSGSKVGTNDIFINNDGKVSFMTSYSNNVELYANITYVCG